MDGAGLVNSTNTLPLRNVLLLAELIERVQGRNDVLPGMACFSGPSGLGKTSAAAWCANRYDAYHVEMKNTWSPTKFAQKIVTALGMSPKGRLGDLVEIIGEELLKSGRPLLIDEGHLLANTRMVGVVYDIYESSKGTIILIGEELMPQTLTRWERFHNRILDWVPAQPSDLRETGMLAQLNCPGIEISEDVLKVVLHKSQARARRIVVNLQKIHEHALKIDKSSIDMADIERVTLFTGEAPDPRRHL